MDQDYEKRGYLLEDFRLFHLTEAQKGDIPYHYHEFCKLLLLRSGSGGYAVEGQHYQLQPGDVVLLDRHVIHRPEFSTDVPYDRTILYLSPAFLQARSDRSCDLHTCFTGSPVLRPRDPRKLIRLLDAMEEELSRESFGRTVLCSSYLLALLVEVGRESLQENHPAPLRPQNPHILELLDYLNAHLTEDLSIDELAERFFLSKYHLMRLFRRETGETIHGYLTDQRLFHAKALIAQGVSATEACYRSGWRSYSSFTRAYAKRFGTSPTGRPDAAARLEATYE